MPEFSLNHQFGFHEFLMKENFTDTTLFCEKRMIKCHKVLLAASSQYFYDLFNMLDDTNSTTIVLKGIMLSQLLKILEYIYCGKVNVAETEIDEFKQAAEYFEMNINFDEAQNVGEQNNLPEFMSQETTVGNLTLDSFRLTDSDSDTTLNGDKSLLEPTVKKIKLTESFRSFSKQLDQRSEQITAPFEPNLYELNKRKRNYFGFSEEHKKKVAFDILREKCISAVKVQRPKRL